jgi:hypothetical protein
MTTHPPVPAGGEGEGRRLWDPRRRQVFDQVRQPGASARPSLSRPCAPHTHPPRQGERSDAVKAPNMDTEDDDFVESSQADGRPVRSKHQVAHYKASLAIMSFYPPLSRFWAKFGDSSSGPWGAYDLQVCTTGPSRVQRRVYDLWSRSGCLAMAGYSTTSGGAAAVPGQISEICKNRLRSVFTYVMKDSAAKSELRWRCFIFVDLAVTLAVMSVYPPVSRFWGLEPETLGRI